MTANYQESPVAGTKWRRSFRVQIDNPYQGNPRVTFHEEDCVSLADGTTFKVPAGSLVVDFNPSAEIALIDPFTGEPLTNVEGVPQFATHIEAYIMLHSLYIQSAIARDAPPPAQPIDIPELPPEN